MSVENGRLSGEMSKDNMSNVAMELKGKSLAEYKDQAIAGEWSNWLDRVSKTADKWRTDVKTINGDTTLTKDAQDLLTGLAGEKYKQSFESSAHAMATALDIQAEKLNKALYSKNIALNDTDKAIMPYVMPKIEEEGTQYLAKTGIADNIANAMQGFGLVKKQTAEILASYLDGKHSPQVLDAIQWNSQAKDTFQSLVSKERAVVMAHTPTEDHLKSLKANKANIEQLSKLGFGA